MSLEFENAPYCKAKGCTALLTHKVDYDRGLCISCYEENKNEIICNNCSAVKPDLCICEKVDE